MLKDILNAFKTPTPSPLRTDDAHTALAALLVRLARVDHDYHATEKAMINAILSKRYGLDQAGIDTLREQAETLEAKAPDTQHFTHMIKQAVPYEDREHLIEDLWTLTLADGKRDNAENSFLRLVSSLLGVTDKDSALARQRVIKRAG